MKTALAGATIIFDLDGTLVDSAPDLVRALNAVIQDDGYPAVSSELVRQMVGRGARALLRRAYARSGTALPEPALDRRVAHFLKVYEAGVAEHSRPFPGAEAALEALDRAGATSVIATNKPQRLTDLLIEALDWKGRFARVLGADAVTRKKPNAAHLEEAAGGRLLLARALMVGDTDVDVAAARAARVPVVVMSHGYSETPVERLGADRVLERLEETEAAAAALIAAAF
jgi:phosphoglycolate phosphatase